MAHAPASLLVAATSDFMLAYMDFFLGGDEKRNDLPPRLHQRFPVSIVFGGDGSYMVPFSLQSDNILTNLMSQCVPPTIWYRLVAGLNAQLRLVRRGHLRSTFRPVVSWIETHANKTLRTHGVRVDLTRFQPSASGYCQFGLVLCAIKDERTHSAGQGSDTRLLREKQSRNFKCKELTKLQDGLTFCYPFYYITRNIKPVCHQDIIGLIISVLLLGDFSLVLLVLLQLYSISMLDVFLVLFIPPLGILLPFPAGINALFSHGPKRSAGLARIYALWNITSVMNVAVAFICGLVQFKTQSSSNRRHPNFQTWNFSMDESGWWMLPCGLILCKIVQARLIDCHVANLEIQDKTLYSSDTNVFWRS
ncbi:hypothetical protein OROHE_018011 [Orobanche hederae]